MSKIQTKFKVEKGKVKWYDENKGFGFLLTEDGTELFIHKSGLYSPFLGLYQGEEVKFNVKRGPNGPQAVDVKTIK